MDETKSLKNKRIVRNMLMLYGRMILVMVVALYTSRIVLSTLGIEDYGIYNVVGGVVVMFSVITRSLSVAISRFLIYELGTKNLVELKKVFSIAVTIQFALSLLIVILVETVGLWFLYNKMYIPSDRLNAAFWVLQCSMLTFILKLISIPYDASIISHERMDIMAYVGFLEVGLKLAVVYLLALAGMDKLIFYAILLVVVAVIIRLCYGFYCKRNFEECTYTFVFDKGLFKKMVSFAGWNFIGSSAVVLRSQGINIAVNIFFGPAVNAARGIAEQVNMAVGSFLNNFMTALDPQITKSFVSGDHTYMMDLVKKGCRFSSYLLLFLSLPILIDTEYILSLWLKEVPDYTVNFVRLILLCTFAEALSATLIKAMLATGDIKKYQIIVGGVTMLNLPIAYYLLKFGFPPEVTYLVIIFFSMCNLMIRIYLLRDMIGLRIRSFIYDVVLNVFLVSFLAILLPLFVHNLLGYGALRFLVTGFVSVSSTILVVYYVGCSKSEKQFILEKLKNISLRKKREK
ncbi:MAG: oligosaccharide flippase family protein [Bacteroidaceae bacterium]|nr:oligosaccharide flippase family protein [Bacteroidaceae bacterium]